MPLRDPTPSPCPKHNSTCAVCEPHKHRTVNTHSHRCCLWRNSNFEFKPQHQTDPLTQSALLTPRSNQSRPHMPKTGLLGLVTVIPVVLATVYTALLPMAGTCGMYGLMPCFCTNPSGFVLSICVRPPVDISQLSSTMTSHCRIAPYRRQADTGKQGSCVASSACTITTKDVAVKLCCCRGRQQ